VVGSPRQVTAVRGSVPIQLAFDRRRMPAQLGGDPTHREAQPEQVGDLQPFPDEPVKSFV
jgi:hypothetical protein